MEINPVQELQAKTIKGVGIAAGILSVVFFLLIEQPLPYIVGLLFGTLIGILNFLLLANTIARAVQLSPGKAQGYATKHYFLRFVIYGVVLLVSIRSPHLNVLGTAAGLLLIKAVIMAANLFNDKTYFTNIFQRKEED